jgi:uncharacterized repeat protein (TIGR01451 family)
MGRFTEFAKRAVQRVNARIAMLVVSTLVGGGGAWTGYSYWKAPAQPKGPIKQVATGVPGTESAAPVVQTAMASLSDDQVPEASATGSHRLLQYSAPEPPATAPPSQSNSYLPASNDPPGGYGGASTYGQYAATAPTTSVPSDPASATATSDAVPENIYRRSSAAAPTQLETPPPTTYASPTEYPPLSQSPYASATDSAPQNAPAIEVPAYSQPATSYGASSQSFEPQPAAAMPPPNPLPTKETVANPYAAAPQPRSLTSLDTNSSPTNPYSITAAQPATITKTPAGAKAAAATPGERQLEGPQQPAIALEKVSPGEIQVGKPATFELFVRNTGQAAASGVTITDYVPAGTQLIDARPAPQQNSDGSLVWTLGTMQPGEETHITLQVLPQSEGEIGSTAQVTFAAAATSRSICTRPQLTIEQTAPPKVLIGDSFVVGITVSNPGTGPATGVIIEEDVPAGIAHVAGSQLEYEVGTLRPGESKHLDLSLRAEKAGVVQNVIQVRGEASLAARHAVQIEIVAPQLQVAVEGPKVRFLERQATYTVQIANPGTAAARDVDLIAHLPRGMKFVSTDSQGQYDVSQHAVYWSLAELPPATRGSVKLTTLPVEPGDQPLRVEGRGALGVSASGEQIVRVEQAAEIVHTVKDLDEVIEVGSETTYEVRVLNKGTKAATNVRVAAQMPPGMAAMHGEGPTRATGDATQIVFEALARLNPQEEVIYKVQAQGKTPGDQIVRVQVSSDEWPSPVTREESTRVYQDR